MAIGVNEIILPFLLEPSAKLFDEKAAMLYSQTTFNSSLTNSFLDILLKYKINVEKPSSKTKQYLTQYLINFHEQFPKNKHYENAIKSIAESVLEFNEILLEEEFNTDHTNDFHWEVLSRNSIINGRNDENLNLLFEEMCVALNYGNYIKAMHVLHCIRSNNSYAFGNDKFNDIFIQQSLEFLTAVKSFKLMNHLSWELILLDYADKK